ncbi:unnamed protein product [Caenorhabditis bovis]|uniref:Uncharacterized protein n=1 Tax=Caenorhabditis bovis TaxID=2654633 RepID=A0A8S1EEK3_9PELO|nr:unnamed protein product [Caenorhabditis bovis]
MDYDPHGGRNAFRNSGDSSSERALRAIRSFTQSIEDDIGPPELPPSLDIDVVSMKTSDTNETIIEVKQKVDPQLGETQKYKMAVPGPGHSEQEHELHKSLIRDDDDESEIEAVFANGRSHPKRASNLDVISVPPKTLSFSAPIAEPSADELRHAYDKPIRKRPTTPTSACVLDGIAFFAPTADDDDAKEVDETEKIKVSIPTVRKKKHEMSYTEFYESMANQMPHQGRRMSGGGVGGGSGRTTPLNDYDGDILDEHPLYKGKAPPPPVVHRRSSIEWENFADMEEKMEQAEKKLKQEEKEEEEESEAKQVECEEPEPAPAPESKTDKELKKLTFYAKPPTVEITSPDMPHSGCFHEPTVAEEPEKEVGGVDDDDDEPPTFSEDMDEERQRVQHELDEPKAEQEPAKQEEAHEEYDPNAYPGYIWNYETQQWEYDPNYVDPNAAPAQDEYDYSAYGGYEGYLAACKAYEEQNGGQYYDQSAYYGQEGYAADYSQAYPHDQASYAQDQQQYYHYDSQAYSQDPQAYSQDPQGYSQDPQAYSQDSQAYQQSYHQDSAGYAQDQTAYSQDPANYGHDQTDPSQDSQALQQSYQLDHQDHQQCYTHDPYTQEQQQEPTAPTSQHYTPIKPLFEQPPAPANDPYAWDAPSEKVESPKKAAPPARPPPARPEAPKQEATPPARPPPVSRPPPPRPAPAKKEPEPEPEPELDAWAQFKKMTEKVSDVVKTTETTLKTLSETSAANDIKDESYLAQIGGSQGFVSDATQREIQRLNEEKKMEKLQKKKLKQQGKKAASPPLDLEQEDAMDRAAQELAIKLAKMRTDIGDWKAPEPRTEKIKEQERKDSASAIPPRKKSSIKDVQQDSGGSLELPPHLASQDTVVTPKGDFAPDDPILSAPAWADFESSDPVLPPSESGFFSNKDSSNDTSAVPASKASDASDPFVTTSTVAPATTIDPFAPQQPTLIDESYDPFAVVSVDEIVAMAKAKAEQAAAAGVDQDDDFYNGRHSPALSTPTPEGGSPISQRPNRFEDDFKCDMVAHLDTPTPLYDEDDSQPLADFLPKFTGDGWDLMVRHPIKKKSFMAERCWKPCYVKLHGNTLLLYNDKKDATPIQELLLQATYSLSDTSLQAYDVYGKIHTVKLQYVVYKEKVGIRPGQISRLVDGHITKYGLPLEHSAQCTVLLKFGSLNAAELQSFVTTIEDILFKCQISRTGKPIYKQDEVQIHCYDEYSAFVDKDGVLSDQRARVRLFCLAFLTGSPILEVGLNDRRRQGKEIVRRKDILPMYTERWIRFEALEFHSIVNREAFEKEQVITFSPPDGCFFEIMRFRVRPPRNREKAMTVKSIMKIAGSKVEIRIEAMAAAQIQRTRGSDERRQIPCEDITIRFPIPEAWIYLFREERHWGVGSIHSKKLRPGKVKNLKDRLLGAVQTSEANLIECAIGEAKYEHVYRSLVWRIPRLPEKHHAAYKAHLLKCRFELSSFDLMPEEFLPRCEVEFTMPLATVSNTVVRSVSVEQHEDSDRVEKFVRYVAKYNYKVEIDYIQCANLDLDLNDPSVNAEVAAAPVPELHQPAFQPGQNEEIQQGYRIDFNETELGGANRRDDSSSDEEPDSHKMPIIQIDMKNYGY